MLLTISGWAVLKFSIIPLVSWRLPATSRMLRVTGLAGALDVVVPVVAPVVGTTPVVGTGVALELHAEATSPAATTIPSRLVHDRSCIDGAPPDYLSAVAGISCEGSVRVA